MIKWLFGSKSVKEVLRICGEYDKIYRAYRAAVSLENSPDNPMLSGFKGTLTGHIKDYDTAMIVLATEISSIVEGMSSSEVAEVLKSRNGRVPSIEGILTFKKKIDHDLPKAERIVQGLKQPRLNRFYVKRSY